MKAPVLFLFFNRPDTAESVFSVIRAARPSRLFLAADGPRPGVDGESDQCRLTRERVESLIDWPCEVHRLYRDDNLGCRAAVSSAINWFFSHVVEGIILEDDTLPNPSFFRFADAMLERYRGDGKVMHISGNNFQFGRIRGDGAYYASRFAHSWGWATWKNSWEKYDIQMNGFPEQWDQVTEGCNLDPSIAAWWKSNLIKCNAGECNTWDYQWHYTVMKNKGLCLIPNINLVKNIGIGSIDATHMKHQNIAETLNSNSLFNFHNPSSLHIHHEADMFDFRYALHNRKPPRRSLSEWKAYFKFWTKNNR